MARRSIANGWRRSCRRRADPDTTARVLPTTRQARRQPLSGKIRFEWNAPCYLTNPDAQPGEKLSGRQRPIRKPPHGLKDRFVESRRASICHLFRAVRSAGCGIGVARNIHRRPPKKVLPELVRAGGVGPIGTAQQTLAQLRESIVITDADFKDSGPKIVYANEAFTRLTGYLPREVIGKNPGILQGPRTVLFTLEILRADLERVGGSKAKTLFIAKTVPSFT